MRRFLAAALALVILLAACADGDDDDTAATSTTASTTTTSTTLAAAQVPADPSAGCDSATPVAPGEERVTLPRDGGDRFYLRHVPPTAADGDPLPLVVDLHGYSVNAEVQKVFSGLAAHGDAEGFVTVLPQGQGAIPFWNYGIDSPDVTFVAAVVDDAEEDLCIDRRRVHVAGMSNGAMMTSTLVCALGERISAAAPVAGIREVEGCPRNGRPVPLIAFHGTADNFVAFEGGLGEAAANLPAPDGSGRTLGDAGINPRAGGKSVPEIVATWARRNGCEPTPSRESVTDDVVLVAFPCPEGFDVHFYEIVDGGHAWPGSQLSAGVEHIVGRTTMSISANELIWAFFEEHPLR